MEHSFVISGFSRSGTSYTTLLLRKSPSYIVKHDPQPSKEDIKTRVANAQKELDARDYVGYCSGAFLHHMDVIQATKKAWLIRNPYDILLSILNNEKNADQKIDNKIASMRSGLEKIHKSIYSKFKIEELGTIKEFKRLLEYLDITDIDVDTLDLKTKKHVTTEKKYKDIKDIPLDKLLDLQKAVDWFCKIYYPIVSSENNILIEALKTIGQN